MNGWDMWFDPKTLAIHVDWTLVRQIPHWKRQAVALYVHEFTHLLEWIFLYRRDTEKWNNEPDPEKRANKAQAIALTLLGLGHLRPRPDHVVLRE